MRNLARNRYINRWKKNWQFFSFVSLRFVQFNFIPFHFIQFLSARSTQLKEHGALLVSVSCWNGYIKSDSGESGGTLFFILFSFNYKEPCTPLSVCRPPCSLVRSLALITPVANHTGHCPCVPINGISWKPYVCLPCLFLFFVLFFSDRL